MPAADSGRAETRGGASRGAEGTRTMLTPGTDRSLGDRCIVSRGGWPHVIVNAGSYGNIVRIIQSPGLRRHHARDDSRDADHPSGRPPARQPGHSAVSGRFARSLGGRHAGGRGDELLGQDRLQRIARDAASRRALLARGCQFDQLHRHHRRPLDVHEAVDDWRPSAERQGAD